MKPYGNFNDNENFHTSITGSGDITIEESNTQEFSSFITGSRKVYAINKVTQKPK